MAKKVNFLCSGETTSVTLDDLRPATDYHARSVAYLFPFLCVYIGVGCKDKIWGYPCTKYFPFVNVSSLFKELQKFFCFFLITVFFAL